MEAPQHALRWIEKHGCFKRSMSLTQLRKKLGRVSGECTWCAGPVKRKGGRWCSEDCRVEGYIRCHPSTAVVHVFRRDGGICAKCGKDTMALKERVEKLYNRARGYGMNARKHCYSFARVRRVARAMGVEPYKQPYEVDHMKPVVEGGGLCGLDNYQTLCIPCHKADTKELAARRARQRREESRKTKEVLF